MNKKKSQHIDKMQSFINNKEKNEFKDHDIYLTTIHQSISIQLNFKRS
jgi:hypothetical protein